jgi:hypothetical protein
MGCRADKRPPGTPPGAAWLAPLVVVRVVALAAQEINPAVRHGAPSVLIAVDDGTPLDDPEYGGADLIVARAALEPAPVATADPPTGADPAPELAPLTTQEDAA